MRYSQQHFGSKRNALNSGLDVILFKMYWMYASPSFIL